MDKFSRKKRSEIMSKIRSKRTKPEMRLHGILKGNRKIWGGDIMVTAIEDNKEIAEVYQKLFPKDKVIITDAHQYLLDHFREFNFIWSSPPCPTHSVTNHFLHAQGVIRYPDMRLWQEIIFLKTFFYGKFCVENVKTYYEPLIRPQKSGRHYFWANFHIPEKKIKCNFNIANMRATTRKSPEENLRSLESFHGFDLSKFKIKDKRKVLRNCVNPEIGKHIWECAYGNKKN